jgi:hypothetical protein
MACGSQAAATITLLQASLVMRPHVLRVSPTIITPPLSGANGAIGAATRLVLVVVVAPILCPS